MITYLPDDDVFEIACCGEPGGEPCPERVIVGPFVHGSGLTGPRAAGLAAERLHGFARIFGDTPEADEFLCNACARAVRNAKKEARYLAWWRRKVQPKIDAQKAAREKARRREERRQALIR